MTKPLKAYEELFEDLMEYTDFKSSDEIKTKNDLYDFFKQVKDDSEKKGRHFRLSKALFDKVYTALAISSREIEAPKEKIKHRGKMYRRFKDAKIQKANIKYQEKEIYRSYSKTIKGDTITRWRDSKGRFVKAPDS